MTCSFPLSLDLQVLQMKISLIPLVSHSCELINKAKQVHVYGRNSYIFNQSEGIWINSVPAFIDAFAIVLRVDVEQTMKPTVSLP